MRGARHEDRYGLPLSTHSSAAASSYRDGIDRMLSAWPGAAEAFDRAIADDPDFALAHIVRARAHSFHQQGDAALAARGALAGCCGGLTRKRRFCAEIWLANPMQSSCLPRPTMEPA